MKNIDVPIIAIDFEGSSRLGIVEYGAAEFYKGELLGVKTRICKPNVEIPARDCDFFDISNSVASREAPFSDDVEIFLDMRRRGIFAAHNAVVEDSLLRAQAPTPAQVPNFLGLGVQYSWSPWLDSYVFCKNIFPSISSAKLSNVISELNLEDDLYNLAKKFCPKNRAKWHCALFDAIACGLIFTSTCAKDGFENVTLDWLAKYSGLREIEQGNFNELL